MVGAISPKTGFEPKISVAEACRRQDTVRSALGVEAVRVSATHGRAGCAALAAETNAAKPGRSERG